ncbi:hypothetical protein SNEBB_007660 [Seison nebaliae]|nr:hypothetical protein SNEBB_007660 [Seison nebaliae]
MHGRENSENWMEDNGKSSHCRYKKNISNISSSPSSTTFVKSNVNALTRTSSEIHSSIPETSILSYSTHPLTNTTSFKSTMMLKGTISDGVSSHHSNDERQNKNRSQRPFNQLPTTKVKYFRDLLRQRSTTNNEINSNTHNSNSNSSVSGGTNEHPYSLAKTTSLNFHNQNNKMNMNMEKQNVEQSTYDVTFIHIAPNASFQYFDGGKVTSIKGPKTLKLGSCDVPVNENGYCDSMDNIHCYDNEQQYHQNDQNRNSLTKTKSLNVVDPKNENVQFIPRIQHIIIDELDDNVNGYSVTSKYISDNTLPYVKNNASYDVGYLGTYDRQKKPVRKALSNKVKCLNQTKSNNQYNRPKRSYTQSFSDQNDQWMLGMNPIEHIGNHQFYSMSELQKLLENSNSDLQLSSSTVTTTKTTTVADRFVQSTGSLTSQNEIVNCSNSSTISSIKSSTNNNIPDQYYSSYHHYHPPTHHNYQHHHQYNQSTQSHDHHHHHHQHHHNNDHHLNNRHQYQQQSRRKYNQYSHYNNSNNNNNNVSTNNNNHGENGKIGLKRPKQATFVSTPASSILTSGVDVESPISFHSITSEMTNCSDVEDDEIEDNQLSNQTVLPNKLNQPTNYTNSTHDTSPNVLEKNQQTDQLDRALSSNAPIALSTSVETLASSKDLPITKSNVNASNSMTPTSTTSSSSTTIISSPTDNNMDENNNMMHYFHHTVPSDSTQLNNVYSNCNLGDSVFYVSSQAQMDSMNDQQLPSIENGSEELAVPMYIPEYPPIMDHNALQYPSNYCPDMTTMYNHELMEYVKSLSNDERNELTRSLNDVKDIHIDEITSVSVRFWLPLPNISTESLTILKKIYEQSGNNSDVPENDIIRNLVQYRINVWEIPSVDAELALLYQKKRFMLKEEKNEKEEEMLFNYIMNSTNTNSSKNYVHHSTTFSNNSTQIRKKELKELIDEFEGETSTSQLNEKIKKLTRDNFPIHANFFEHYLSGKTISVCLKDFQPFTSYFARITIAIPEIGILHVQNYFQTISFFMTLPTIPSMPSHVYTSSSLNMPQCLTNRNLSSSVTLGEVNVITPTSPSRTNGIDSDNDKSASCLTTNTNEIETQPKQQAQSPRCSEKNDELIPSNEMEQYHVPTNSLHSILTSLRSNAENLLYLCYTSTPLQIVWDIIKHTKDFTSPDSLKTLHVNPRDDVLEKSNSRNSINVRWTATLHDNGSKIEYYQLEYCTQKSFISAFIKYCQRLMKREGASVYQDLEDLKVDFLKSLNKDLWQVVDCNTKRSWQITNLLADTVYIIRVKCKNFYGHSEYSWPLYCSTAPPLPKVPGPIEIQSVTMTEISLCWERDDYCDVVQFELQVKDESSGHGFIFAYTGENNENIVKNLRRNSPYEFRLRARSLGGTSEWSETMKIFTQPDAPDAPKVQKHKLRNYTLTHTNLNQLCDESFYSYSAELFWNAPNDTGGLPVDKYMVEIRKKDDRRWNMVYDGKEKNCVLNSLIPSSTYEIRMSCTNERGWKSNWSEPTYQLKTKASPPSPPSPGFINRELYRRLGLPIPQCRTSDNSNGNNECNTIDLHNDCVHIKWLKSKFNGGQDGQMFMVVQESIGEESNDINRYKIWKEYQKKCNDSSQFFQIVYKGKENFCSIQNLLPNQHYLFRISASNDFGNSYFSLPLRVNTLPFAPDPPVDLSCSFEAGTSEMVDDPTIKMENENTTKSNFERFNEKLMRLIQLINENDKDDGNRLLNELLEYNQMKDETQYKIVFSWMAPKRNNGKPIVSYRYLMQVRLINNKNNSNSTSSYTIGQNEIECENDEMNMVKYFMNFNSTIDHASFQIQSKNECGYSTVNSIQLPKQYLSTIIPQPSSLQFMRNPSTNDSMKKNFQFQFKLEHSEYRPLLFIIYLQHSSWNGDVRSDNKNQFIISKLHTNFRLLINMSLIDKLKLPKKYLNFFKHQSIKHYDDSLKLSTKHSDTYSIILSQLDEMSLYSIRISTCYWNDEMETFQLSSFSEFYHNRIDEVNKLEYFKGNDLFDSSCNFHNILRSIKLSSNNSKENKSNEEHLQMTNRLDKEERCKSFLNGIIFTTPINELHPPKLTANCSHRYIRLLWPNMNEENHNSKSIQHDSNDEKCMVVRSKEEWKLDTKLFVTIQQKLNDDSPSEEIQILDKYLTIVDRSELNNYKLNGLQENKKYEFRIRTETLDDFGVWSEWFQFQTTKQIPVPPKGNINMKQLDSNSIDLLWQPSLMVDDTEQLINTVICYELQFQYELLSHKHHEQLFLQQQQLRPQQKKNKKKKSGKTTNMEVVEKLLTNNNYPKFSFQPIYYGGDTSFQMELKYLPSMPFNLIKYLLQDENVQLQLNVRIQSVRDDEIRSAWSSITHIPVDYSRLAISLRQNDDEIMTMQHSKSMDCLNDDLSNKWKQSNENFNELLDINFNPLSNNNHYHHQQQQQQNKQQSLSTNNLNSNSFGMKKKKNIYQQQQQQQQQQQFTRSQIVRSTNNGTLIRQSPAQQLKRRKNVNNHIPSKSIDGKKVNDKDDDQSVNNGMDLSQTVRTFITILVRLFTLTFWKRQWRRFCSSLGTYEALFIKLFVFFMACYVLINFCLKWI